MWRDPLTQLKCPLPDVRDPVSAHKIYVLLESNLMCNQAEIDFQEISVLE